MNILVELAFCFTQRVLHYKRTSIMAIVGVQIHRDGNEYSVSHLLLICRLMQKIIRIAETCI
jgi:hypothetical protein